MARLRDCWPFHVCPSKPAMRLWWRRKCAHAPLYGCRQNRLVAAGATRRQQPQTPLRPGRSDGTPDLQPEPSQGLSQASGAALHEAPEGSHGDGAPPSDAPARLVRPRTAARFVQTDGTAPLRGGFLQRKPMGQAVGARGGGGGDGEGRRDDGRGSNGVGNGGTGSARGGGTGSSGDGAEAVHGRDQGDGSAADVAALGKGGGAAASSAKAVLGGTQQRQQQQQQQQTSQLPQQPQQRQRQRLLSMQQQQLQGEPQQQERQGQPNQPRQPELSMQQEGQGRPNQPRQQGQQEGQLKQQPQQLQQGQQEGQIKQQQQQQQGHQQAQIKQQQQQQGQWEGQIKQQQQGQQERPDQHREVGRKASKRGRRSGGSDHPGGLMAALAPCSSYQEAMRVLQAWLEDSQGTQAGGTGGTRAWRQRGAPRQQQRSTEEVQDPRHRNQAATSAGLSSSSVDGGSSGNGGGGGGSGASEPVSGRAGVVTVQQAEDALMLLARLAGSEQASGLGPGPGRTGSAAAAVVAAPSAASARLLGLVRDHWQQQEQRLQQLQQLQQENQNQNQNQQHQHQQHQQEAQLDEAMHLTLSAGLADQVNAVGTMRLLRATQLLESLAALGPEFQDVALFDLLLSAVVASALAPPSADPTAPGSLSDPPPATRTADIQPTLALSRSLAACARASHLVKRSTLVQAAGAMLRGLSALYDQDPAACVSALWALGRYRVMLHEHAGGAAAVATLLAHLAPAWQVPSSTPHSGTTPHAEPTKLRSPRDSLTEGGTPGPASVASGAVTGSAAARGAGQGGGGQGEGVEGRNLAGGSGGQRRQLGLEDATLLATALADLEVQPEAAWLDQWLSSLLPHLGVTIHTSNRRRRLPANASSSSGPTAPHEGALSHRAESPMSPTAPQDRSLPAHAGADVPEPGLPAVAAFLSSLARMGYAPDAAWMTAVVGRLVTLGSNSNSNNSNNNISNISGSNTSNTAGGSNSPQQQEALTLAARQAGAAVQALEAVALMGAALSAQQLCSRAVELALVPGALLHGGSGLPARLLAAIARLLPERKQGTWVRANLPSLEQLLLAASAHMKDATPAELLALVSACATLKFYPGRRFLRWHDASCTRLGKTFPDHQLYLVREAYICLGFRPEQKLYQRMEAAKVRVLRVRGLQRRRQLQIKSAMDSAERQMRLDAMRERAKARRGLQGQARLARKDK